MDPLSQIIALVKPQAVGWRMVEIHGGRTIHLEPPTVVVFGQMIEGGAAVERDDGVAFEMEEGDFMMMPLPPPWRLAVAGGGAPIDVTTIFVLEL